LNAATKGCLSPLKHCYNKASDSSKKILQDQIDCQPVILYFRTRLEIGIKEALNLPDNVVSFQRIKINKVSFSY